MIRRRRAPGVGVGAIAVVLWASIASAQPPQYRHAYYLFLADTPTGCEACYVPLLLTPVPLEALGADGGDVIVLTTYERDSVWSSEKNVRVRVADVVSAERKVRGTIPIGRPMTPTLPPAELARPLADFRVLSSQR